MSFVSGNHVVVGLEKTTAFGRSLVLVTAKTVITVVAVSS